MRLGHAVEDVPLHGLFLYQDLFFAWCNWGIFNVHFDIETCAYRIKTARTGTSTHQQNSTSSCRSPTESFSFHQLRHWQSLSPKECRHAPIVGSMRCRGLCVTLIRLSLCLCIDRPRRSIQAIMSSSLAWWYRFGCRCACLSTGQGIQYGRWCPPHYLWEHEDWSEIQCVLATLGVALCWLHSWALSAGFPSLVYWQFQRRLACDLVCVCFWNLLCIRVAKGCMCELIMVCASNFCSYFDNLWILIFTMSHGACLEIWLFLEWFPVCSVHSYMTNIPWCLPRNVAHFLNDLLHLLYLGHVMIYCAFTICTVSYTFVQVPYPGILTYCFLTWNIQVSWPVVSSRQVSRNLDVWFLDMWPSARTQFLA